MQNLIMGFQDGINKNSDRIYTRYNGCIHNAIGIIHDTIGYKHYTIEFICRGFMLQGIVSRLPKTCFNTILNNFVFSVFIFS